MTENKPVNPTDPNAVRFYDDAKRGHVVFNKDGSLGYEQAREKLDNLPTPKLALISWQMFNEDTLILAHKIKARHIGRRMLPLGIIAVSRGGLVPAGIIAQALGIKRIETICVESYDAKVRGDIRFLDSPFKLQQLSDANFCYLIIDDLVDSGATMRAIQRLIPTALCAAVYAKPNGRDAVTICGREMPQDQWLQFPWE